MKFILWLKYYFYAWCYVIRQIFIMAYKFFVIYGKWYKHFWKEWNKLIGKEWWG